MSGTMDVVEESERGARASEVASGATSVATGRRRRGALFALVPVLLGALFLLGYLPRAARRERLVAAASGQGAAPLRVSVVAPRRGEGKRTLKLPATIEPSEQTEIHARANGYVRRWRVDLGERVQAGQPLLEIDTPELDREREEARAELLQRAAGVTLARANREFAEETRKRYELLTARKLTSKHELEQHQAEARVSEAKVQVAEAEHGAQLANLRRLEQLKAFAEVRAPFAGTITARHVERGALVSAGSRVPLFELANLDTVRVNVDVPQSQIAGLRPGVTAELSVAELPTRRVRATLAHSAGRLDPKTRTMRIELSVPNEDGALVPGMYATVSLLIEQSEPGFVLPASAVLQGKEGTRVALVGADGRVRFAPVEVERDRGAEVEIARGLAASDRVIVTPPPGLSEGARVRIEG